MDVALFLLQLLTTLVLAATLIVVIIYTLKTAEMAEATRDLARSSQDQLVASREQVYDQHRPLLVPEGVPIFQDDHSNWLKWEAPEQRLSVRNIGSGPALTIAGVLYGCESYLVGELGAQQRATESTDTHWTCWLGLPIAPGETAEAPHELGASTYYANHKRIGRHTFNAPPEPNLNAIMNERTPVHSARSITTYVDVYGRKHASVFDYVPHTKGWELIEFIPDIGEDLHDLEGKA